MTMEYLHDWKGAQDCDIRAFSYSYNVFFISVKLWTNNWNSRRIKNFNHRSFYSNLYTKVTIISNIIHCSSINFPSNILTIWMVRETRSKISKINSTRSIIFSHGWTILLEKMLETQMASSNVAFELTWISMLILTLHDDLTDQVIELEISSFTKK